MALVKRQNNNTKIIGIAAAILVVGVTGYFLFNKFYLQAGSSSVVKNQKHSGQVISNFGEALLNDHRFTGLTPYQTNISLDNNTEVGQPTPFQ